MIRRDEAIKNVALRDFRHNGVTEYEVFLVCDGRSFAAMQVEVANVGSRRGKFRGCLVAVVGSALFVLLIAAGIYTTERAARIEFERNQEQRRAESFKQVKSGRNTVSISDPELIVTLANDADCIENLRSIYFFMTDLDDPRYRHADKLTNIREVGFYDCKSVDNILKPFDGMPSIESLFFESVDLNDETIKTLDAFPNLKKVQFEQILDQAQIDLLKRELPNVAIEVADQGSGERIQIQAGTR